MWRRCLVVALLALAGAASAAEPPFVGIYGWGTDPSAKLPRWLRFYERLRELGWRDGDAFRILKRHERRLGSCHESSLRGHVRQR